MYGRWFPNHRTSPDLAPSDYHLFGPLKNHLRGTKFSDDEAVKEICREWLKSQPRHFYAMGILKLVHDGENVYQNTGIMLKNKS